MTLEELELEFIKYCIDPDIYADIFWTRFSQGKIN